MLQTSDATNRRESPELLTVAEAAVLLKLSAHTVYRLVESGGVPSMRVGGSIRIDRAEMFDALAGKPIRVEETESS